MADSTGVHSSRAAGDSSAGMAPPAGDWRVPAWLARIHLAIGLGGVVIFLATGYYMDRSLAHLEGMADGPRALYRSGHIYILFAALLHLLLGAYVTLRRAPIARLLQYFASGMLTLALALFVYGFMVETPRGLIERPRIRLGIELCLGGVLLHGLVGVIFRARGELAGDDRA